jgi:hypothetical protein
MLEYAQSLIFDYASEGGQSAVTGNVPVSEDLDEEAIEGGGVVPTIGTICEYRDSGSDDCKLAVIELPNIGTKLVFDTGFSVRLDPYSYLRRKAHSNEQFEPDLSRALLAGQVHVARRAGPYFVVRRVDGQKATDALFVDGKETNIKYLGPDLMNETWQWITPSINLSAPLISAFKNASETSSAAPVVYDLGEGTGGRRVIYADAGKVMLFAQSDAGICDRTSSRQQIFDALKRVNGTAWPAVDSDDFLVKIAETLALPARGWREKGFLENPVLVMFGSACNQ